MQEQNSPELEKGTNRRQQRMSRRRQEILSVAARFFAEVGYERTTFEMIASELGLSQPALYYYVTKKEDILAQLLEELIHGIIGQAHQNILPTMSADEKLACLIKAHVACLCQYPEGKAFILYESHLLSERTPEILDMRDQYQQLLEDILAEGVEQGIFHVEDIKLTTIAFLGTLNWIPRWFSPQGRLSPEMIGAFYARLLIKTLITPGEALSPHLLPPAP